MIASADKNVGLEAGDSQPEYKKIQDYVYKFSDQIGMGNFSKVFKGVNQCSNKQVAIKIIELSSLTNSRLQQLLNSQTKILKSLSHPNVIGCEQILSSVNNCYIITELCNGGDLEKKLRKAGHFKQKDIYAIAVDIYEGLKYLGKKSIIHRDIKVSNVFINKGLHKIADFGFAQLAEVQFKDISVGSPIYMSPEGYIHNVYGPKTDVWAFGVLLYQLVEGKTPCFDCRTQAELRTKLMKQIDHTNFTSHCSNELKNLVMQCMQVNPTNRIKIEDIEHTTWMKKAFHHQAEAKKMDKENHNQKYRKISEDLPQKSQNNSTDQKSEIKKGQEISIKNYLERVNTILGRNDDLDEERKRKHLTLEKAKGTKDDSSEKEKEDGKVFYSPKNTFLNYQKNMGFRTGTQPHKFQQFMMATNVSSPDNSNYKNKTDGSNMKQHVKDDKARTKTNWIDKLPRDHPNLNLNQNTCLNTNTSSMNSGDANYQKDKNCFASHNVSGDKLDDKDLRKGERQILSNQYKNYLNATPLNKIGLNAAAYQRSTPRSNEDNSVNIKEKEKNAENTKISFFNRQSNEKEEINIKEDLKRNVQNKCQPMNRVILRNLKFADCIGIIHYCRLCYKFACLLDEAGESSNGTKQYLTAWSVQLLSQLNSKMDDSEVLFNERTSVNNQGGGEVEKKKRLRDVTEEYLNKYSKSMRNSDKSQVSLKEASSFIYNLYIQKGCEYKEKTKDKKPEIYYALIGYISLLDRETRNLMEFLYEIKSSMDCKQVERLLNVKITDFNQKLLQDFANENDSANRDSQKK